VKYVASTHISDKSLWSQSFCRHPFSILGGEATSATSALRLFLPGVLGAGVFKASAVASGDGVLFFACVDLTAVSFTWTLLEEAFGAVSDADLALGDVTFIWEDGAKYLGALTGQFVGALAGTALAGVAANWARFTSETSSSYLQSEINGEQLQGKQAQQVNLLE
jgi:hypothetical protein